VAAEVYNLGNRLEEEREGDRQKARKKCPTTTKSVIN
jgi:hypothetical protein